MGTTSQYTGLYKEVVEAGWGISIGILFRATVPSGLRHHAESLSPAAFCNGMASAQAAVAYGSTILVPNATHVKVTTTNVDAHEDGIDWAEMGFLIGVVTLLLCCLGAIIAAAAAGHR